MVVEVPSVTGKVKPDIKTITKPGLQPVHAWTIVAHEDDEKPNKKSGGYEDEFGKEDEYSDAEKDSPKNVDTKKGCLGRMGNQLNAFYFVLKFYGINFSPESYGKKNCLLLLVKIFAIVVTLLFMVVHWAEVVCTLKEDILEYGSCLINLVFTARMTSGLVSHIIFYTRRRRVIKVIERLDEIGHAAKMKYEDKRKIIILLIGGLASITLYCLLSVKFFKDQETIAKLPTASNMTLKYHEVHEYTLLIMDNVPVNFFTFFVLLYDVVAMTFFVAFAYRFYTVFHDAPFCRWLNNGKKHEIGTVMKRFRAHHNIICNVVEQVDGAFAPTVLIWYVYLTLALCCWIRAFSTSAFESIGGAIIVSIAILTTLVEFYMLSVATSLINDEVTAHLDAIRMMCINEDLEFTSSMTALQDRISHLSYVTCVLASPVSLTGWGFFSVSKGFVLTVSSTVLTFTLVLYGV